MAPSKLAASCLEELKVDRKGRYKVGSKLGEGAFGTVYKLVNCETGDDGLWAVKVTPNPKRTKNRRSKHEKSAGLLNNEGLMYQSVLVRLQGDMIPKIPPEKEITVYGTDEEAGFKFLVMEQMDQQLFDSVLAIPLKNDTIDLSHLARRMLQIFKRVHEAGCVITDVKPENFMIARGEGSIVDRLRLLDLAFFTKFRMGKHLPNVGIKQLQGTPMYASLHTHDLNTPSRRDDIAALLFLIMDLVICRVSHHTNESSKDFYNESYLPWNQGRSDDEIGELKKQMVVDANSELFNRMTPSAAAVLFKCWQEVSTYKYKQEPSYDFLDQTFGDLVLHFSNQTKLPATKQIETKPRHTASAVAAASSAAQADSKPRRPTLRTTPAAAALPLASSRRTTPAAAPTPSVQPPLEQDDDVTPMEIDEDWEQQENLEPATNVTNTVCGTSGSHKGSRTYCSAIVKATSGPHNGEEWIMQEGSEVFFVGSKPSKPNYIKLSKDPSVDANHAKLVLHHSTKLFRINVWDINSKAGTFVNGTRLKGSTDTAAGSAIRVGDTTLTVTKA